MVHEAAAMADRGAVRSDGRTAARKPRRGVGMPLAALDGATFSLRKCACHYLTESVLYISSNKG